MTFTYASSSISTNLAKVRLLIGDTSTGDQIFQDEEVNFFIDNENSIYGAAAMACEAISAEFARKVDKSVGDLKLSLSQKAKAYSDKATKFWKLSKLRGSVQVYAGGISVSDKDTQEEDTDRVEPFFYVEMHDNKTETSSSEA